MCLISKKIEKIIFAHLYKKISPHLLPSIWQRQNQHGIYVSKEKNERLRWRASCAEMLSFPLLRFLSPILPSIDIFWFTLTWPLGRHYSNLMSSREQSFLKIKTVWKYGYYQQFWHSVWSTAGIRKSHFTEVTGKRIHSLAFFHRTRNR